MCNKGFVLSENFVGDNDLKNNKCLVIAKREDFKYQVKHFIKCPMARTEIANNAYNYIKKYRRLDDSIKKCMGEIF